MDEANICEVVSLRKKLSKYQNYPLSENPSNIEWLEKVGSIEIFMRYFWDLDGFSFIVRALKNCGHLSVLSFGQFCSESTSLSYQVVKA